MYIMKRTFNVKGMHCAACVANVEKAVASVPGVQSATVNLALETVTVELEQGRIFSQIQQTVKKAGYTLTDSIQGDFARRKLAETMLWQRRFRWQAVLGIPLLVYSMAHMLSGQPHPSPIHILIQFLLTTPLVLAGRHFYVTGISALIRLRPSMDSLVAMGTGAAYLYSVFSSINLLWGFQIPGFDQLYFESAGVILLFITLGRFLEAKAKGKTVQALTELFQVAPSVGWVFRDNNWTQVPAADIQVGDKVQVKPGEKIPVDGLVLEGETHVNEAAITGESMPVKKGSGDKVIGATMNVEGAIVIKTLKVGDQTLFARIIKMVEEAQATKAPIQALADRVAAVFVPVVIGIAILGFITWLLLGMLGKVSMSDPLAFSVNILVSVLIIACPCALGLATPTAIVVGTGLGARSGIHFKSAEALQRMSEIDTMVFDKTGTLTTGEAAITDIHTSQDKSRFQALFYALESRSEHHLAKAILTHMQNLDLPKLPVNRFRADTGFGVRGIIEDELTLAGSLNYLRRENIVVPDSALELDSRLQAQSKTVIHLTWGGEWQGLVALADSIRIEAEPVIYDLQKRNLSIWLITGDNERTAALVAKSIGIPNVMAEVLPEDKSQKIRELKASGKTVAMVGDGINDAPALAAADVGISISSGTDVAIETSDVVLMNSELASVMTAFRLSQRVVSKIRQNLFWAFIYNIIGIPIALGLLYPFTGILLNPMFAGAAMALSSVSVVGNTLLLRRFES